jgi:CDP-diacylglycerol--inositol 3-phosphatidyltransferase
LSKKIILRKKWRGGRQRIFFEINYARFVLMRLSCDTTCKDFSFDRQEKIPTENRKRCEQSSSTIIPHPTSATINNFNRIPHPTVSLNIESTMPLPIPLYIPNLLGYARIILAFVGLHLSGTQPGAACVTWIFSAFLDLFDGILARKLDQCSSLGVLIDIAADNILRTTVWVAVADQSSYGVLVSIIISLEWTTMVCTQLHATQSGTHWKTQRKNDPWLLKQVFANNFRGPLGCLVIYGLFSANIFVYGIQHPELEEKVAGLLPFFTFWKYAAFCGRALSMLLELWMCKGYLSLVISRDLEDKKESNKSS